MFFFYNILFYYFYFKTKFSKKLTAHPAITFFNRYKNQENCAIKVIL